MLSSETLTSCIHVTIYVRNTSALLCCTLRAGKPGGFPNQRVSLGLGFHFSITGRGHAPPWQVAKIGKITEFPDSLLRLFLRNLLFEGEKFVLAYNLKNNRFSFFPYFRNSLKNKVIRLFPQAKLRPKIRITGIIGNKRPD